MGTVELQLPELVAVAAGTATGDGQTSGQLRWPACTQGLIANGVPVLLGRACLPDLFAHLQVHSVCFLPQVLVAGSLEHVLGVAPAQEAIDIFVHTVPAATALPLMDLSQLIGNESVILGVIRCDTLTV